MPSDRIITKYELDVLDNSLLELSKSQFSTTEEESKYNTGYTRFDFTANSIIPINHELNDTFVSVNWMGFKIDYNFIPTNDRDNFVRSDFYYNDTITLKEISDNYMIFSNNILIFIDGVITISPKIMIRENYIFILFEYNKKIYYPNIDITETIVDIINRNAKITIYFTPNYQITTTDVGIRDNRKNNGIHTLNENSSSSFFINKADMVYFSFIGSRDNDMAYYLSSDTINNLQEYLPKSIFKSKSNLSLIKLGLPYCKISELEIGGEDKYIEIPKLHAPVIEDNILVFEEVDGSSFRFSHDIRVKRYYINILEILNNTEQKKLKIFIFSNETTINDYNYSNRAWLYNYLSKDKSALLNAYKKNIVPSVIKNFSPYPKISPNIKGFTVFDGEKDKYGISYKKKVMRDACKYDELSSLIFYSNLIDIDNIKTIFTVGDIPNIFDRTFTDNSSIITEEGVEPTDFGSEHVLFISQCRTQNEFITRIYTVDGIALFDNIYRYYDGIYDYTFIPRSLLNDKNTLIEIDTRAEVDVGYETTFNSLDDEYIITPYLYKIDCYINNIFMYDVETNRLIDRNKFDILLEGIDGNFIRTETTENFKKVNVASIRILDEELIGRKLIIKVVNKSVRVTKIASHKGEVAIFEIPKSFNRIGLKNHFKVYINGRMIPNAALRIAEYDDSYMGIVSITVNIELFQNDRVECFYDPIATDVVFFRRTDLPNNHMINIRAYGNSMSIPLHYKWNDFYINGRKLHYSTMDILTACRFYYNSKIKSSLNCEVRMRLADIINAFTIKKQETNIDEQIFDVLEQDGTVSKNFPDIENTETDILENIIESQAMEFIEFSDVYLRTKFIKPFINQVDTFVQERFPRLLVPETKDIYIETETRYQPVPSYYGYINPNEETATRIEPLEYELYKGDE